MAIKDWLVPWRARRLLKAYETDAKVSVIDLDEQPPKKPKSWTFDPQNMTWVYAGDTPSDAHPGTLGLDYGTLMTISRIPVIGAILQTRIQQVGEFAQPQPSPYSVGFRVRLREAKKNPTQAEEREARRLEAMIMRAGGKYQFGGFDTFLRMITRDSLTYDQGNSEIIMARGGKPWGFIPVDAATIRKAKPTKQMLESGRWDPDKTSFVQMVNDKVVNEYAREEVVWGIRRPRTWTYANGYGYAELEELISIVTDLLNAQTYNSANFRTGIHSQTLLLLFSGMTDEHFRAVHRQLISTLNGPSNRKRTVMLQLSPGGVGAQGESIPKDDMKSIPLGQTNKDMEYSTWLNWLLKIVCACYQMDPAELGFVFGNEGQSGALAQHGPSERIWASKERGLRPLLRSIQQWLNLWFIWPLNENYVMEFVGFDSLSEQEKLEMDVKATKCYKTINETRAEHELDLIDGPVGDLILDPVYFQAWQQMRAEEQQAEGGYEEGEFPTEEERPAGEAVDEMTRSLTAEFAQAEQEGRLLHKGRPGRKLRPWVPVPTTRRGTDKVRAYVVEV
jgi:hypothetical protein